MIPASDSWSGEVRLLRGELCIPIPDSVCRNYAVRDGNNALVRIYGLLVSVPVVAWGSGFLWLRVPSEVALACGLAPGHSARCRFVGMGPRDVVGVVE